MTLDDRLVNAAVIGAAGKMGSGIALLLAHEMYLLKRKPEYADAHFRLNLIDTSEAGLEGLLQYLKAQFIKKAEKSTILLRDIYADRDDLVENAEIIDAYVDDVMSILRLGTDMNMASQSSLIFEAIVENIDIKIDLYKKLNAIAPKNAYFFTNTSSVPIQLLNSGAGLGGRIIGFHFYNPPAVQRLAELIPAKETLAELKEMSMEIGARLRKKIFLSSDVAGFIGNGHFLRDALYAIEKVRRLEASYGYTGALYTVNKASQDLLLRPMGIFQLMDYVGVDVMYFISKIMDRYIDGEDLSSELIDTMYDAKVLGGQRSDGSQKDGFLKYEKNRPVGIYDLSAKEYTLFSDSDWAKKLDEKFGACPKSWSPWKVLLSDPARDDKLKAYFRELCEMETPGAKIALDYLKRSKEIGRQLVDDGVAASKDDVNGVLMNGFYHLYGPINDYC